MSISTPHPNSVSPDYSDSLPSITQDNCETSGDPHPSGNIGESDDFSALSGRHFDAKNFLSSTAFATPDSHDDVGNPIQTPNFTSIMTESATNGSFLPAPSSTGCLPTPSNQRGRKNFITRFYQTQMGSPQLSSAPEILSASPHSGKSTTETPARPTCRSEIFGSCPSVYNPFESFMLDSLHKNTFSPSVFAKVLSPSAEDVRVDDVGRYYRLAQIYLYLSQKKKETDSGGQSTTLLLSIQLNLITSHMNFATRSSAGNQTFRCENRDFL